MSLTELSETEQVEIPQNELIQTVENVESQITEKEVKEQEEKEGEENITNVVSNPEKQFLVTVTVVFNDYSCKQYLYIIDALDSSTAKEIAKNRIKLLSDVKEIRKIGSKVNKDKSLKENVIDLGFVDRPWMCTAKCKKGSKKYNVGKIILALKEKGAQERFYKHVKKELKMKVIGNVFVNKAEKSSKDYCEEIVSEPITKPVEKYTPSEEELKKFNELKKKILDIVSGYVDTKPMYKVEYKLKDENWSDDHSLIIEADSEIEAKQEFYSNMSDYLEKLSREKRRSIKFRFTKIRDSSTKLKKNILDSVEGFEFDEKDAIEELEHSLSTALEVEESLKEYVELKDKDEKDKHNESKVKKLTKEEKDEEIRRISKESDFVTECEVKPSIFEIRHDNDRNVDYICDRNLSILVKVNRYRVSLKLYNGDIVSVNEEFRATGYEQLLKLVTASSQVNLDNPDDVKSVNVMDIDNPSDMKTFGVRSRISLKGEDE